MIVRQMVLLWLFASVLLAATGQIFLKVGVSHTSNAFYGFNVVTLLGIMCYAIGMILWIASLSRLPLHVVYPFTLLTFVLVGVASIVFLGERPSLTSMMGWAVIVIGIGLVFVGGKG